jgi:hypothetical protein
MGLVHLIFHFSGTPQVYPELTIATVQMIRLLYQPCLQSVSVLSELNLK